MANYLIEPSPDSPETRQAIQVLQWMDRNLLQKLSPKNAQAYQQRRYATDSRATTRRGRLFPGGPKMPIPPMPVSGTGDEAFGHNRLASIVAHLIVPMIDNDELNKGLAIEIRNRCRGEFGREYQMIDRALTRANIRNRGSSPSEEEID